MITKLLSVKLYTCSIDHPNLGSRRLHIVANVSNLTHSHTTTCGKTHTVEDAIGHFQVVPNNPCTLASLSHTSHPLIHDEPTYREEAQIGCVAYGCSHSNRPLPWLSWTSGKDQIPSHKGTKPQTTWFKWSAYKEYHDLREYMPRCARSV